MQIPAEDVKGEGGEGWEGSDWKLLGFLTMCYWESWIEKNRR